MYRPILSAAFACLPVAIICAAFELNAARAQFEAAELEWALCQSAASANEQQARVFQKNGFKAVHEAEQYLSHSAGFGEKLFEILRDQSFAAEGACAAAIMNAPDRL